MSRTKKDPTNKEAVKKDSRRNSMNVKDIPDQPKYNKTNEIDHDLLPDNTFTMILKVNGKVYARGGLVGDTISKEMADEDLDSTLRAINGAGVMMQRTLAVKVAGRDIDYRVPGNKTVEQDLTPLAEAIADIDIEKSVEVKKEDIGKPDYAIGLSDDGIVLSISGNVVQAEADGYFVSQPAPKDV